MAIILKDRVKETTNTAGTADFVLAGSSSGYQAFSVIGANNYTYYCCYDNATGDWEVGYGQYTTTAGGTLVRDAVLSNSATTTTKISFAAGPKDVFITYPAEKAIYEEATGNVLIDGGPITVVGNGVTSYTSFTAVLGEMYGNVNSYAQFYAQNYSNGSDASGDFVVYRNDALDDTSKFVDIGINSSNYNSLSYPIFSAGSAYAFNDGGEMFFGSATDDVVFFAGGVQTVDEAMRIDKTTKALTTTSDVNVGGGLDVTSTALFGSTVTLHADPTTNLEAATKQYVDNVASLGIIIHTAVRTEAVGNLTATYNNGTAGVGATLTNSGVQAALVLDGITVNVNDRVLVMDQTTQTQNGVYTVTDVGSGSTNWVLTRATDADTYGVANPNKLAQGSYFYIQEGNTAAGESYVCSTVGAILFGTTAITFSQFSAAPAYTGGTNIDVTGQTISLTGTVAATNGGTGVNTVATGDLLYGSAPNTWSKLTLGAQYRVLVSDAAGIPQWGAVALNQSGATSGTLPSTSGGTGQSSYALGDLLYSDATNSLTRLAGNTTTTKKFLGQTGTGSGSAAPVWQQPAATDITGLAASATTDTTDASNISSGTLPSGRLSGSYTGITGVGTLTAGTWNGSTIGPTYGGTGFASYTVGDLLYADTTTSLAKLADVAVGNALISGGVSSAPSWGKIGLSTHVSGTLPIGNGGTNSTATPTAGGVPYGTGTAFAFTAAGTAGQALISNGASAPTWGSVQAFPSGTAMLFVQTAAPTGWTKSVTHNDKALRVVSGTASSGGSVAFTTAFASQAVSGSLSSTTATNQNTTATGSVGVSLSVGGSVNLSAGGSVANTTITTTTMPSHTHLNGLQRSNNSYGTGSNVGTLVGSTLSTGSAGSDGAHSHGFTNPSYSLTNPSYSGSFTGTAHTHTQDAHTHTFTGTAINLAVQYVDVIIATKD